MHAVTILSAIFVLTVSMIIRSIDALRFQAFGVDTFTNLLYSKRLRHGTLNLYKVGKIVYPPFLPRLIYYLQGKLSIRKLHLIPKLFDLFTSVMVLWFSFWLSGDEFAAFLALLLYTFSPINVINGYGIGTRTIGSSMFVLTILASYVTMFSIHINYAMLILAIFSCILMMLTSRIAYKSYMILVVSTAILLLLDRAFIVFILVSGLALVLCLLITRGRFVEDLKGHLFLIGFFKNRMRRKSIIKQFTLVFYYDFSWCLGILVIIKGADLFLSGWLLTIVALSFFWPWGEGERHIALATAPSSILATIYLVQQPFLVIPLLLLEISIITRLSLKIIKGQVSVSVDRHLLSLFDVISKIEGDSLFLCLPLVYSAPIAFFCEKKVLYGESSSREGVFFQAEVLDSTKTQSELEELVLKYPVTHIFIDRYEFPLNMKSNLWLPIIQEERFTVLRRENSVLAESGQTLMKVS